VTLAIVVFAISTPLSFLAVAAVLRWLRRKQILDHPNERSSHSRPTPRGGGLAITPLLLIGLLGLGLHPAVIGGAAALFLLSWRDDRGSLPASVRLALQLAAVAVGLFFLPPILPGLPFWADRLLAGFAWLWFVNLYNFMDGIDGITGIETISLAIGLALLGGSLPQSALLAGVMLGFLGLNWHPAKIFLGDSGSVPLGYLLGWMLLSLAGQGHQAAALILPAYYLADATLTLVKRALRFEPIWQAHRQHLYQQAVRGGASHAQVSLLILFCNAMLIATAWLSAKVGWAGLPAAVLITAALLIRLGELGRRQSP